MGPSYITCVNKPSFPIDQLYKHMVSSNRPITPFISTNESIDDTASLWTLFSHTGIYIMAIGLLIPAGLGIFCCYFSLVPTCQISMHQPLQSGSMQHTIVDDDVEAAPIYRCDGMAGQPIIRPHENHGLCMETGTYMDGELTEATSTVKSSSYTQSHWIEIPKSREHAMKHIWFVVRFKIGPVTASLTGLID